MKYTQIFLLSTLLVVLLFGCSNVRDRGQGAATANHADAHGHDHEGEDAHGHAHGAGAVVKTIWQDSLEMFGEWAPFEAGHTSEAVLHFTSLVTFQPAIQGPLKLEWESGGHVVKSQVVDTVTRTGIFIVDVQPPDPGLYSLAMTLSSPQMSGTVRVPDVQVFAGHAPHDEHAEESATDEISFLKEQQWMLGTKTGLAHVREVHNNVRAPGELMPAGNKASEAYSPFAGVLMPDPRSGAIRHGQEVRKGQPLAQIAPSPNADNSWFELLGEYRLARTDLDRVQSLFDRQAASDKRLEEARQRLSIKEAQLTAALGGAEISDIDSETPHYTVLAPRAGIIAHHDVAFGEYVDAGQRLFGIVDPDVVWLEVRVAAADVRDAVDVQSAYFTLSGSETLYSTTQFGGKVIATGSVLDPVTRRVPITYELDNRDGLLKVGEFAQVEVQTSASRSALVVPRNAVIEDGGASVVYVQSGGESFVRRVVTTGATDGPWVEILSGVQEGERIATDGAYKIKLASGTVGEVGHGHAH